MKRVLSMCLAVLLLLTCVLVASPEAHAAQKKQKSRAIAIVFDNSGSMYGTTNSSWCRATYAMEVFASMMNDGDKLRIYPMNKITVDGETYDRGQYLEIKSVSDAAKIRRIVTPTHSGITPIESVDHATSGLQTMSGDEKYLVILTDGAAFWKNNKTEMSKSETKKMLDQRINTANGMGFNVMYLGIGKDACMPDVAASSRFVKNKAEDSADVLSMLTEMCNQIFGRDTLPKKHISGKTIDFDISLNKLIVFVQGDNIANLKVVGSGGKAVGSLKGSQQVKFSENETNDALIDKSLQGMMVTYADCAAGQYTVEFSGTASSVEVYYEPNADLDFVFTDASGNEVDPNALYEGEYKVSFGMKDGKTGKLIKDSDLLGKTSYRGSYTINGKKVTFNSDKNSGEVPVDLKMGDKFEAELTVTYLSGYTITKDSTDFGWPNGGISVAARPAGDLRLEFTGGQANYSMQKLNEGQPFILKIYYENQQLTGAALKSAEPMWDEGATNAKLTKEFADDHWKIYLSHKDPSNPQNTTSGECTVPITAAYTAPGSNEKQSQGRLTYTIDNDFSPLEMELVINETYLVIGDLEQSPVITVNLTMNGAMLTAEEFAAVELQVNTGGIEHTVTPRPENSAYEIKYHTTEGIAEGKYKLKVSAKHTDLIGRATTVSEEADFTLSNIPLWLKWAIALLILLILIIIIWIILHIKVLPSHAHISKRDSKVLVDGEEVAKFCNFSGGLSEVVVKYGGSKIGLAFPVKPGKESYLYKKQTKRYAEVVNPATIKKIGNANIESATIGSVRYVLNDKGILERKPAAKSPLNLKHGMPVIYSGTINSAGVKKSFNVNTKLNFKK